MYIYAYISPVRNSVVPSHLIFKFYNQIMTLLILAGFLKSFFLSGNNTYLSITNIIVFCGLQSNLLMEWMLTVYPSY